MVTDISLWLSPIGGGAIKGRVPEWDVRQNGALRRTLLMNETTSAGSFLRGLCSTRQTYITLTLSGL